MEILTGILLGLSTLLFIGPVFFFLVQTTIIYGKKAGVAAVLGIIIGDVIYILLILKGLSIFFEDPANQKTLTIIGGVIVLFLGLKYIFKPKKKLQNNIVVKNTSLVSISLQAFVLNFINPFVIFIWIGFFTYNQSIFQSQFAVITSLVATLFVIFITDLLKVFFAGQIKKKINISVFLKLQKWIGILMILFAIRLFYTLF